MESFISRQELAKLQNRSRTGTWVFRGMAAGTLALFIILCLIIRTANARTVTWAMFISMTLLGWLCIGLYMNMVRPTRAKARHLDMLLSGETEEFEGILRVSDYSVQVPKSIRVRRISLEGAENPNPTKAPERKSLNLDDGLTDRMPAAGSRVRVQAVNDYVTGVETLEACDGVSAKTRNNTFRQIWRKVSVLIIPFILWTMTVVIVGGFVFSRLTEIDPRYKIVIYADCDIRNGAELADLLEQQLDDPIRMVVVRSFSYDMFGTADIQKADLYIVSASKAEEFRSWFVPLPEDMQGFDDLLILDDEPYGIPIYRAGMAGGSAQAYLDCDREETYYLIFSAASLHLSGNNGATDNRAAEAAEELLTIP